MENQLKAKVQARAKYLLMRFSEGSLGMLAFCFLVAIHTGCVNALFMFAVWDVQAYQDYGDWIRFLGGLSAAAHLATYSKHYEA